MSQPGTNTDQRDGGLSTQIWVKKKESLPRSIYLGEMGSLFWCVPVSLLTELYFIYCEIPKEMILDLSVTRKMVIFSDYLDDILVDI